MRPQDVIRKKRDGLSLSREEIDFFIDGRQTGSVTRQAIEAASGIWVFDDLPQQIILNVAVGGWGGVPGDWTEQVMSVDWVRVWAPPA